MQRAPRTAESYFNVNESITLLNIVKSDRIQNAFRSNRKNHASVWKMVASILSRYNDKERSAKQCCNRYENLKKIYTQLKRNPEKHFRRNWPYMYLFREIEEQRGECWGSNSKRIKSETSYTATNRTPVAALTNEKQHSDVDSLMNQSYQQLPQNNVDLLENCGNIFNNICADSGDSGEIKRSLATISHNSGVPLDNVDRLQDDRSTYDPLIHIKEEYPEQGYDTSEDNSFLPHYNRSTGIYENGQRDETNILHPDVIVDTDHVTDSSSISISKRKLSTSTDAESTNYELIDYLKRRERRDEQMLKRMEDRENRLIKLLERTVVAIEQIASHKNTFNHK